MTVVLVTRSEYFPKSEVWYGYEAFRSPVFIQREQKLRRAHD